jgi:uncharacterized membrane protein
MVAPYYTRFETLVWAELIVSGLMVAAFVGYTIYYAAQVRRHRFPRR